MKISSTVNKHPRARDGLLTCLPGFPLHPMFDLAFSYSPFLLRVLKITFLSQAHGCVSLQSPGDLRRLRAHRWVIHFTCNWKCMKGEW